MRPSNPLFKGDILYLLRHRQGPVLIASTPEVTDRMIRIQLPKTKVPVASRRQDWSLLAAAQTPDSYSAFALRFYLYELRRKRERLYEKRPELAQQWFSTKFPKRNARTFEAVSDLANALEYLYNQPAVNDPEFPVRAPNREENKLHPIDVRKPEGRTTVYWPHDWYKGSADLWIDDVQHKRLNIIKLESSLEQLIREGKNVEPVYADILEKEVE
ncbi:hypothetical protein V1514DRAFT_324049 [Lipomyces japonicus]|uniref:uncharacterized protein n=1 Tax=Lipomyces japonicus TaxID=56871 RepID=UPI0034CE347C